MLLSITTTHPPATDLGYLLHKHPDRFQTFSLAYGQAHVYYPVATAERCTAALLLDIDPVGLVRGRGRGTANTLQQYVNDRPYVASSFLSVAIAQVYGTAMAGKCDDRPELAAQPLPLEAQLTAVPDKSGGELLERLFGPLGYQVALQTFPLDERFPEWGPSAYVNLTLQATLRLADLLTHLYVLIPVLDGRKHYWVGEAEVKKLLRRGEGWLQDHPEKELIASRYLRRDRRLIRAALEQLVGEDTPDLEAEDTVQAAEEQAIEEPLSLHEQRLNQVLAVLKDSGARRVLDLGCGEGRLLRLLLKEKQFEEIVGLDVSYRALEIAKRRLRLERLPPRQKERLQLWHGSLMYRDLRLIYGPDYTLPANLERLRKRGLSRKRSLALREFALGLEALERFVRQEPLYRVHECVFGVLALESEPVDPRL
jgi:3' terminal RNA ribose 2'-O-methyltransferase Hen1